MIERLFPGFSIYFLVPVLGEQTVLNQNGSIHLNAEVEIERSPCEVVNQKELLDITYIYLYCNNCLHSILGLSATNKTPMYKKKQFFFRFDFGETSCV